MDSIREGIEDVFEDLERRFYVDSALTKDSKVIFVLESPHIQELQYGAPVSGRSGATMSKHLFGPDYNKPLGRLIKKNMDDEKRRPSLNVLGLMNICGIPMQRAAYKDQAVTDRYTDFFDRLEGVRQANQKDRFKDENWQTMQDVILDRFRVRLVHEKERVCTFVPCGRFAQKFFRLADIHSDNWQVIDEVPHPSYNSWDRDRYQIAVEQVKQAFQQAKDQRIE